MTTRVKLAAATWTDLAAAVTAEGGDLIVRPEADMADLQVAISATAPTTGTAVARENSARVLLGAQGTLTKVWARSTAGGYIVVEGGASVTLVEAGDGVVA